MNYYTEHLKRLSTEYLIRAEGEKFKTAIYEVRDSLVKDGIPLEEADNVIISILSYELNK